MFKAIIQTHNMKQIETEPTWIAELTAANWNDFYATTWGILNNPTSRSKLNNGDTITISISKGNE